jgi:hypothetical protein
MLSPPNYQYTKEQLQAFTEGQCDALAASLGMYTIYESINDFVDKVLQRYDQVEPFNYQQHYIANNKGPDQYLTCGMAYNDEVVIWDPPVECVACHCKDSGDKRIGRRAQVAFSFVPKRKTHRIKSNVTGKKDKFEPCTEADGYCGWCAKNIEARWDGMKYLSLSQTHAGALFACADRIAKRCAKCGIGTVRNIGWACCNPECGEPVANPIHGQLNQAQAAGQRIPIVCPECKHKGPPDEILKCVKGCEAPRRCQIFDIDVLVQRIGSGKSTTYQFTEQLPAEVLDETLLSFRLPRYEQKLKPKSTDQQTRQLGLHTNPFTGKSAGGDPEATESYEEDEGGESDVEPQTEPFG